MELNIRVLKDVTYITHEGGWYALMGISIAKLLARSEVTKTSFLTMLFEDSTIPKVCSSTF